MGIVSHVMTILIWVFVILFNVKYINDVKHLKRIMLLELALIIWQTVVNII